jgi:hypothetical protein
LTSKGLLCHYSSYFKAALGGNFKESKEGFVSLEDETEQTFKLFLSLAVLAKMVGEVGREHKGWLELAELFVFADKRGAPKLKNRIIDEIVARNIQLRIVPVTVVPYVYANTLESSPLRKLLVDLVAWDIDVQSSNVFDTPQSYKDYLFDLVRAVDERPSRGTRPTLLTIRISAATTSMMRRKDKVGMMDRSLVEIRQDL